MSQLKDIVCYQKDKDEEYYKEDSFSGRVLIYDNNKFEGIVTDYFHDTMQFVFGTFTTGGIRVYRTTNGDQEVPKVYMGERIKGRRYQGKLAAASRFVFMPITDCKVSIVEPDTYRDVEYEKETADMQEGIKNFRKHLGEEAKALYQNVFYEELQQKRQNTQK